MTEKTATERLNSLRHDARNVEQWKAEAAATLNTAELIHLQEYAAQLPMLIRAAQVEVLREEQAALAAEDEAGKVEAAGLATELAAVDAKLKPLQESRQRVLNDVLAAQADQRDRTARQREVQREIQAVLAAMQRGGPLVDLTPSDGVFTAEQIAAGKAARARKDALATPERAALKGEGLAEAYGRPSRQALAEGTAMRAMKDAIQAGTWEPAPDDEQGTPAQAAPTDGIPAAPTGFTPAQLEAGRIAREAKTVAREKIA